MKTNRAKYVNTLPCLFVPIYKVNSLFALSSLELHLFSELVVFVLAHFHFAPLFYVSHSSTSLSKNSSKQTEASIKDTVKIFSISYLLPTDCCLLYSLAWSIKASSCISMVGDSDPSYGMLMHGVP
jgi:hypothetical protein